MLLNLFYRWKLQKVSVSDEIVHWWCHHFRWIVKINTLSLKEFKTLLGPQCLDVWLAWGVECHFSVKATLALSFQTPMQCKLWDNRVQPIAASVYSIYFFTRVPIASFPLPALCVAVLWSLWPSPCVFTFGSDLSSATSGEPNTNWTVTIHRLPCFTAPLNLLHLPPEAAWLERDLSRLEAYSFCCKHQE